MAVVAYREAARVFEGAALPDRDAERLYSPGVPSADALTLPRLQEQPQPAKK